MKRPFMCRKVNESTMEKSGATPTGSALLFFVKSVYSSAALLMQLMAFRLRGIRELHSPHLLGPGRQGRILGHHAHQLMGDIGLF